MMRSSWSTWPVSSFWIASEVFFLGRRRGLSLWPEFADPFIHIQQLFSQVAEALALRNLAPRFG
jgi:hypothetical protein